MSASGAASPKLMIELASPRHARFAASTCCAAAQPALVSCDHDAQACRRADGPVRISADDAGALGSTKSAHDAGMREIDHDAVRTVEREELLGRRAQRHPVSAAAEWPRRVTACSLAQLGARGHAQRSSPPPGRRATPT